MSTRFAISLLISMMTNAVLFGAGATVVLAVPTLSAHANVLLPLVIVVSFVLGPIVAWIIAPMMQAQYQRTQALRERLESRRVVAAE